MEFLELTATDVTFQGLMHIIPELPNLKTFLCDNTPLLYINHHIIQKLQCASKIKVLGISAASISVELIQALEKLASLEELYLFHCYYFVENVKKLPDFKFKITYLN